MTPVVFLLSGMLLRLTANAGYMTGIVYANRMMASHSLKSSDNVINIQVRDVTTCFTEEFPRSCMLHILPVLVVAYTVSGEIVYSLLYITLTNLCMFLLFLHKSLCC